MTSIITKLRYLLRDLLDTTGRQTYDYLSTSYSKVITLNTDKAIASSIKVYKNGIEWSSDNWTYDVDTAQLTIEEESGEELEVGDVLLITFSYYQKYSDTILEAYIRSALYYISIEQYKTFEVESGGTLDPTPSEQEENLIAIIAAALVGGNVAQYRTPELSIVFNSREPVETRIRNFIRKVNKSYGVLEYIDLTAEATEEE